MIETEIDDTEPTVSDKWNNTNITSQNYILKMIKIYRLVDLHQFQL